MSKTIVGTTHTKQDCKVLKCSCVHEYQDKTYGSMKRVHNPFKRNDTIGYRCTVCGMEK